MERCYTSCLELAEKERLKTIAFPCISTGIFRYPEAKAAEIAVTTTARYLRENEADFDRIIFCVFSTEAREIYERQLWISFPPGSKSSTTNEMEGKTTNNTDEKVEEHETKKDHSISTFIDKINITRKGKISPTVFARLF